jgi:two-component system, chemotaxis family, CheB/CheR fusion protein
VLLQKGAIGESGE